MGHTPGPWEVVMPGEVDAHYAVMDSFGHTASVYGYPDNAAEAWANASLIAAAPELLEQCKYLLENAEAAGWSEFMLADARAAIAKAEGRGE